MEMLPQILRTFSEFPDETNHENLFCDCPLFEANTSWTLQLHRFIINDFKWEINSHTRRCWKFNCSRLWFLPQKLYIWLRTLIMSLILPLIWSGHAMCDHVQKCFNVLTFRHKWCLCYCGAWQGEVSNWGEGEVWQPSLEWGASNVSPESWYLWLSLYL